MQLVDQVHDDPRFLHDFAQILPAPLAIGREKRRILQPAVDEIILKRPLILQIRARFPPRHFVERRLRDIDVPLLHQLRHLPVEERQQKCANVRAVHVGVGHDDDLVIAQLRQIEVVANASSQRADDVRHLLRRQHLVDAGPLHVEDFTSDRQHRLILALAPLLGRPTGRVALDDEHLGIDRIAILALRQSARQPQPIKRTLAPRQFTRLACRLARQRRLHDLADDRLGFLRMLLEPRRQLIADRVLHHRLHFRGNQFVLRLRGKLRVRHLHRQNARQSFARVLARQIDFLFLRDAALVRILVDHARQRRTEPGQMRAAIALRNVVGEAQHVLVVAVVPPQRTLNGNAVLLGGDRDRLGQHGLLGTVEILHECGDAALIVQVDGLRLGMAVVSDGDEHTRVQKGELAQPVLDGVVVEVGLRERFRAGQEGDLGALAPALLANGGQGRVRHAVSEAHLPVLPAAPDIQFEPGRERVHHRHAHAVQAARHLVGVLVELSARMELGHDDLCCRDAFFRVQVCRDAAAIVGH